MTLHTASSPVVREEILNLDRRAAAPVAGAQRSQPASPEWMGNIHDIPSRRRKSIEELRHTISANSSASYDLSSPCSVYLWHCTEVKQGTLDLHRCGLAKRRYLRSYAP
jgi:hypothetical protein